MPKRKKTPARTRIDVAVAWYRPEDYQRILEICVDRSSMDASYEEWLANAERATRNIRAAGARAYKTMIDPEEFLAWCKSKSEVPAAGARSGYAAYLHNLHKIEPPVD